MADHLINETVIESSIQEREITTQTEIQSTSDDLLSFLKQIPFTEQIHSKLEIVNNIHSQIKLHGEGNSLSEINIELFKELVQQIREGRSEVEKGLLNIILTIAELGSDIVEYFKENQFYQFFKDSELLKQIEQIFSLQLKKKKKDQNSEFILQIVQRIKEISNENKMNGKQKQGLNETVQNKIINGIRSLKSIYCLVEYYNNQKLFAGDLKIYKTISPLIHLNCNPSLNCSQCIILPENDLIHELRGVTLSILGKLIGLGNNVDKYLLDNHSTQNHIIQIIISFTEIISIQFKDEYKYQSQSSLKQDLSLQQQIDVGGALNLLYYLLFYNSPQSQQAGSIVILLSSLFKLIGYKRKRTGRMKSDVQAVNIRNNSNYCLNKIIWILSNEIIIKMIKDHKYIQAEIEGLGNGGGNMEENNGIIVGEICNISSVFFKFNNETIQINLHEDFRQSINEGIEQEGGIEEIEAHLFHLKKIEDDVKQQANYTIDKMNNIYKYFSNQQY